MTKQEEEDLQYDLGGMTREASREKPPHSFILGGDRRMYCSKCKALMNDGARPYCFQVAA